jgi:hypothetical protein
MERRRKTWIFLMMLGALLAIPSFSSAQDGPVRQVESFVLGNTGCQMNLSLEGDRVISANLTPAFGQSGSAICQDGLLIEDVGKTLICVDCTENPDGTVTCGAENCEPKTYVEQNIMEKSGDGSTYCYYTTTRQRVCKTF